MGFNPLISAVCVSHASRFGLAQRAIVNFLDLTFPAERELWLIVSQEGYADMLASFLRALAIPEATPVHLRCTPFQQPGVALLQAMAWAQAPWIAAWDDDNLSHPSRFQWQLPLTRVSLPSLLSESLYYFYDSDELFVTNYAQPAGPASQRCALGSLLFHRSTYPVQEVMAMRGLWTESLLQRWGRDYEFLPDRPWLFLAGSNGDNYRGAELHRRLGSQLPATKTREELLELSEVAQRMLAGYRFDAGKADVCGKDAQAFVVENLPSWPRGLNSWAPPEDWKERIPSREMQARLGEERRLARRPSKA